jgi:hypothetical protein
MAWGSSVRKESRSSVQHMVTYVRKVRRSSRLRLLVIEMRLRRSMDASPVLSCLPYDLQPPCHAGASMNEGSGEQGVRVLQDRAWGSVPGRCRASTSMLRAGNSGRARHSLAARERSSYGARCGSRQRPRTGTDCASREGDSPLQPVHLGTPGGQCPNKLVAARRCRSILITGSALRRPERLRFARQPPSGRSLCVSQLLSCPRA